MRVLAPLLPLALPAVLAAEVYQAPSPEPTPDEVLILEYMNRFRADPAADALRIAPPGGQVDGVYGDVDFDMFRREMQALTPSPPLVFNLQLLDAARKHSWYMVHNGLGHSEEAGKTGFVGVDPGTRCAAAGYTGGGGAENCYAQTRDAWFSHIGFVVDFGKGGEGGMQPGRGHRRNMHDPNLREVGAGAVANGSNLSVTHNLGDRRGVPRFAGGVVYVDLDRDGFYDVGEGRGGVAITASDGAKIQTWASGAFTIELASTAEVTLQAEANGQRFRQTFAAGSQNLKFDWIVPQEADLAVADRLLADLAKAKDPASPTAFKAQVALYVGTRGLCLDEERAGAVATATSAVATQLEAARTAVRAALDGDGKGFRKMVADEAKPFKGTAAAAWFKQVEALHAARQAVAAFEQNGAATPTKVRELVQALESQRDSAKDPDIRAQFTGLVGRVKAKG
ncbi:MAG TPA: CAP domain-containing protein [Planctomycetota bacterium]|nr:CAP domain-containing protein [Planctomycetota bacterium]